MFGFLKRLKDRKFGEIAVQRGMATQKDIDEAIEMQQVYARDNKLHKEIGAILTEKGVLSPHDVEILLEEQQGQMGFMAWFAAFFRINR